MYVDPRPSRLLYVVGQLALVAWSASLLSSSDSGSHPVSPCCSCVESQSERKILSGYSCANVPIDGFPPGWSPLVKLRAFRELARRVTPQVIHSYGFHTNFAAYYAARAQRRLPSARCVATLPWSRKWGGPYGGRSMPGGPLATFPIVQYAQTPHVKIPVSSCQESFVLCAMVWI